MSRDFGRFDDLYRGGDDGGSVPLVPMACRQDRDADLAGLYRAWGRERTQRIEGEIALGESARMIRRLLKNSSPTDAERKAARRMLRLINRVMRPADAED